MSGVLYVRAIETADGSWCCRIGLTEFDSHQTLDEALLHLRTMGENEAQGVPFEIVAHPLEGTPRFLRGKAIENIGGADLETE